MMKRTKFMTRKVVCAALFAAVSVASVLARTPEIDVPENAQPWEKTAADELRQWYPPATAERSYVFHVGATEFAREKGVDAAKLADEEWVVRQFDDDIVLVGGGTRGTLYAVYHFLEDVCDVHWWSSDEVDVPTVGARTLAGIDLKGRPYFYLRNVYRSGKSNEDYRLAVRNRLNASGEISIPMAWGGGVEMGPPYIAHTFGRLLPFEKYGKDHPEWYSLQPDGRREGAMWKGQFCLTNPEVLKELIKGVRASIAKGDVEWPRNGFAKPAIYVLALNDNKNYCHCSNCLEEISRVGCSGQYMRIANAIAEEIGKERPELMFKVSAYLHTEEIPKVKDVRFAKNIFLNLCATKDNLVAPIEDASNAYTRELYDKWQPYADRFMTYNYRITFWEATYDWPVPSEFVIAGKQRYYAEHGAKLLFTELERTETTDMWELKFFLERRLAEDPKADGNALIDYFMPRYYGAAGAHVKRARRTLWQNCREAKGSISWFPRADEFTWVTDATLDEMDREFKQAAEAVKGDSKYARRVAKSRIGLDLMRENRRQLRACKGVYPASMLFRHDKQLMTIVDDAGTASGKSIKIDYSSDTRAAKDLFLAGYSEGASLELKPESPVKEGEWHWYRTKPATTTKRYFYIANWHLQLSSGLPEAAGRTVELRARIKLSGPKFFPGSTAPNAAWVDVVQEKESGRVETHVGFEGNRPYFSINGERRFPLFDLHGNPHLDKDIDDYLAHSGDKFGKRILGIRYVCRQDARDLAPESIKVIGDQIERILANHPDAEFILMPRFLFAAWAKAHPEESVGYAGTDFDPKSADEWAGAPPRPSAASMEFRKLVFKTIDTLADYVKSKPWADRVVAVRPNYGGATEWFTFCPRGYPDCGPAMNRRFRAFLKAKYGREPAPGVVIPTPEQRSHKDMLIDPATNQITIDFYQCMAETMADLLCAVAEHTKKAFPGRLVGMYYGYILNPWPSEAANYLLDRALACPHIDFLSNPPNYMGAARRPGGDYGTKAIATSFRRHGKIHILEDDDRPSFATNRAPAKTCMPVGTDRAVIYRNAATTLFDMGGYQICDPLGKARESAYSFDDPEMIDSVSHALSVLRQIKSLPDDSGNETALVYNYRDKFYADCQYGNPWRERHWNDIYLYTPFWMHITGATFDILSTDDLAATKKRYRNYIFVSCFAPDAETREAILRHTRRPGVNSVWFMAPGAVTPTGISDAPMCALTGLSLKGAGVRPAVTCTDADAARFTTAGGGWQKTLGDGSRAIFLPETPQYVARNRELLQLVGEHFYTTEDAYVRRHGDYLMVHVAHGGKYPLNLKAADRGKRVRDLFSGEDFGAGEVVLTCDNAATWLLELKAR